jgi:hypothetical protein
MASNSLITQTKNQAARLLGKFSGKNRDSVSRMSPAANLVGNFVFQCNTRRNERISTLRDIIEPWENIENKVIVITGTSSGMGAATAQKFNRSWS